MKHLLIIPFIVFITSFAFGQAEKSNYKNVVDSFVTRFNEDKIEDIFSSFSPDMQKALPINQTRAFLLGLKQQAGKITKHEFIRYEQTYASYKTNFEKALFAVNISVDNNSKINGLLVKPYLESNLPKLDRTKTKLILPFKDEWTVIWGGDSKALNYHVESRAQKNAFDLVITDDNGKSYKTDGRTNEDYYAFGKELIAPSDGEVVLVVDGIKDNKPGILNPIYVPGNTVVIKTINDEYLFFGHFKQHSIVVKQGQKIKQGQLLGLCGNSGNSSEPHLHFHVQNIEDMNEATGVKCYFDNILVNGQSKSDYSPIQKEKIRNASKP